ncbi:MAG: DUF4142 domain-containing protein [Gemmatimonadales bacterium]
MSTHRSPSIPLLAAAVLALAMTAAPARPVLAQTPLPTAQDTAKSPWVVNSGGTTPTSSRSTGPAAADSAYIREAASISQLQIRLGTMAGQRSSTAAVKDFARQMVSDHNSMQQQWTSLASRNGLPAAVTLNSIQQQTMARLTRLSGTEFDRSYMDAMVVGHEEDAATFGRIGAGAQSAEVKRLAASGETKTEAHLALARQVAGQLGATGAVATSTPAPNRNAGAGRRRDGDKGNVADGRYAQELAYGHMMEVQLAQMAQKRSSNPKVKQFANQMEDDFSKWQRRWTDLASRHGDVKVRSNLGPLHRQKIERLEKASKGNFDRVYVDIVSENLGSVVPYLQKEGRAAKSGDVRKAVDEELPLVREKLDAAKRLDRQVQVSGKGKDKE